MEEINNSPMNKIKEEKYLETKDELLAKIKDIDLSKVVEYSDNTSHTMEAACAGGACEIK